MDKSTLSNYGWIVIAVLVLSVMIALATPFGTYIKQGVQIAQQGLFDTSEKAMNVVGMTAQSKPKYNTNDPQLNPNDGSTPRNGDVYKHGDYIYTYSTQLSDEGWKVELNTEVTDRNQTTYGLILETINGKPVVSLSLTFQNCTNLITPPPIPRYVTLMMGTYNNCYSIQGPIYVYVETLSSYMVWATKATFTLIGTGQNDDVLETLKRNAVQCNITCISST